MAENGINQEEVKAETELENNEDSKAEVEHTEGYKELIDYGIDQSVAEALDEIYKSGLLNPGDLDSRALDALKEFPADGGIAVLKQFKEANLEHVGNKSAYLCGVMKTYRTKRQEPAPAVKKGPDEAKLKEILERTGYQLDITTGQRKYGGPPPGWEGNQPGAGHEVFCGKIPKDVFEDELIPLFEKCGKIWDLRLMMDPFSGLNRGYCFVTYCEKEGAAEAVKQIDHYEIKKGKHLKVNVSIANLRLFVGNIPKTKSKEEIMEEFSKQTEGLTDVIIYSCPDDTKKKNRGFAFLEYDSHKSASTAKRKLSSGRIRVWGCDIIVDWADPQEEPDDETMAKVKVLYVRNLKTEVTEDVLKEKFGVHGEIDRVKKIKDYGFIHFKERDDAVKAMESLNGEEICGCNMEISLAKPPADAKNRKRRDQRAMMGGRFDDMWGPSPRGMRPPPPGMRGAMRGRGRGMGPGFDFGYDDYGFGGGYRGDPYYDDYYYGFDDFGYEGFGGGYMGGPRGRGGRGLGGPPGRGRVMPPRGARGGPAARGRAGARGGRGAPMRGGRGGARGGPRGGGPAAKRKAPGDSMPAHNKRRNTSQEGSWGAQPIAQQPLNQSEWYQDSYDQWQ